MKSMKIIVAASLAFTLAACNPVTIPNPFGGPPLVLTGNYNADLPSITAFNTTLKAGVQADAAKLQAFFQAACPYVADAQAQLPAAQQAAAQIMTASAAQKQIGNAAVALTAAQKVCNGATASNLQGIFTAAVDAFEYVYGVIKAANG